METFFSWLKRSTYLGLAGRRRPVARSITSTSTTSTAALGLPEVTHEVLGHLSHGEYMAA